MLHREYMTGLLPGMLPYRVHSSCRRMSRTSACCGGQPTSTWPKIPATASLFINFCSACIRRCIFCSYTPLRSHLDLHLHTITQYPKHKFALTFCVSMRSKASSPPASVAVLAKPCLAACVAAWTISFSLSPTKTSICSTPGYGTESGACIDHDCAACSACCVWLTAHQKLILSFMQ